MKKDDSDIVVIFCPPVSQYPKQPADHSVSTKEDCPKCKKKMWLSEKKKQAIKFSELINKKIILQCYFCMMNSMENEDFKRSIKNHTRIDL